ncbi:phosphatidylinositol-3,5-bisphosphate 3-phosphatase MTMR14-like [Dermacentor variabilis]|uniref:phosphatidylinositol-3,5-bisphosphate 3-phosphatase MTMR14-like n=1 Tax=Dermacentor variabilis TaxID=34621 RepID=UPI003F5C03A7
MGSPSKSKSMTLLTESDLRSLMETCSKNVFSSNTTDAVMVSMFDEIQRICVELFDKDYTVKIIDNKGGSLSATYPSKIVFLAPPADDGPTHAYASIC